jgi:PTH1 family peptidyl-tRNA hydrolase
MKLIVGLGNPGKMYEKTRHNVGFLAIDLLANHLKITGFKEGFKGVWAKSGDNTVMLLKPHTFMNLSGESVMSLMQYYKISIEDIVVIYDDLAFNPGTFRLRLNGSSGSHNGIQHIIETLGTSNIKRIRIGIGPVPLAWKGRDFVLAQPEKEEEKHIEKALQGVVLAVDDFLRYDFSHAMSHYNRGDKD